MSSSSSSLSLPSLLTTSGEITCGGYVDVGYVDVGSEGSATLILGSGSGMLVLRAGKEEEEDVVVDTKSGSLTCFGTCGRDVVMVGDSEGSVTLIWRKTGGILARLSLTDSSLTALAGPPDTCDSQTCVAVSQDRVLHGFDAHGRNYQVSLPTHSPSPVYLAWDGTPGLPRTLVATGSEVLVLAKRACVAAAELPGSASALSCGPDNAAVVGSLLGLVYRVCLATGEVDVCGNAVAEVTRVVFGRLGGEDVMAVVADAPLVRVFAYPGGEMVGEIETGVCPMDAVFGPGGLCVVGEGGEEVVYPVRAR